MRATGIAVFLAGVAIASLVLLNTFTLKSNTDGSQAGKVDIGGFWQRSLPDLDGHEQALGQWQGKVAVVNFWATWCPPCRLEIPAFIRLQARYAQAGVQFVGLAVDEFEAVQRESPRIGFNYPILLANEQAGGLFAELGNDQSGLPYTVVFDRQGKAVATFVGGVEEARLEAVLKPLL